MSMGGFNPKRGDALGSLISSRAATTAEQVGASNEAGPSSVRRTGTKPALAPALGTAAARNWRRQVNSRFGTTPWAGLRYLRYRALGPCRLRHKPLLLFTASASPTLNPRDTSTVLIVLGIRSPYAQHFRMITRSETGQSTEDAYLKPGDSATSAAICRFRGVKWSALFESRGLARTIRTVAPTCSGVESVTCLEARPRCRLGLESCGCPQRHRKSHRRTAPRVYDAILRDRQLDDMPFVERALSAGGLQRPMEDLLA
jgi:hypothetical protein